MLEILAKLSNTIGIIGVILVLIAYYLLNTNRVSAINMSYLLLNLIGAWLILFSLMFHWNLASVLIELAWITISVIGLFRLQKLKQQPQSTSRQFIVDSHVSPEASVQKYDHGHKNDV